MVVGGGCPRATLKWLLSLDLSLPIKQVRRDFSNGFLFAEVFHKFFPSEVSLHSYDTGSSLARKKDNWRLLQKVFKRHDLTLSDEEAEAAIGCNEQAVLAVLERLRKYLTSLPADGDAAAMRPVPNTSNTIVAGTTASTSVASVPVVGAASTAVGLQKSPRRDRRHSHGNCNGYLSESQIVELQQQYSQSHQSQPPQQPQPERKQRQAPRKLKVTEQRRQQQQQQQQQVRFEGGQRVQGVASSSSSSSSYPVNGRARLASPPAPAHSQSMMTTRRRGGPGGGGSGDPHAGGSEEQQYMYHHGYEGYGEVYDEYDGCGYNDGQYGGYAAAGGSSYRYASDELIETSPRLKAMFSYEHDDAACEEEALQIIEVVPQRHDVRERKKLVQKQLNSQRVELNQKGVAAKSAASASHVQRPQQQLKQPRQQPKPMQLRKKKVVTKETVPVYPQDVAPDYASGADTGQYYHEQGYYGGVGRGADDGPGHYQYRALKSTPPAPPAAPFVFGNAAEVGGAEGDLAPDGPYGNAAPAAYSQQQDVVYEQSMYAHKYPVDNYVAYADEDGGMYSENNKNSGHMYVHDEDRDVAAGAYAGGVGGAKAQYRVVDYQPYTQEDYEELIQDEKKGYWMLGKLGPDYDPDELAAKREMADKRKAYARNVRSLAQPSAKAREVRKNAPGKVLSSRERAKEFAKNVPKPKLREEARLGKVDRDSGEQYCEVSELERLEMQHKHDRQRLQMVKAELNYMCLKS